MTDLHALLEQAADRLPDAAPPPFETVVARARHRRLRLVAGTGAAAAVVAATVVPWALSGVGQAPPEPSLGTITASRTPSGLPGQDVVTPLAKPVPATGTGTRTVELGNPPAGATAIDVQLSCLSAGTFEFADGAGVECGAGDVGRAPTRYQLPLRAGQHSTTIRAAAGERWRLIATYAKVTTTAWGVNANGLTYGIANSRGTPDLVAVIATNGKSGYVYATELTEPTPADPSQALQWQNSPSTTVQVPVYDSDGTTRIGEFDVHRHVAPTPGRS